MSAINTYKELIDTVDSLERRVDRHAEILRKIKEFLKKYKDNGKANKELADISRYIQSLIEEAYK